MTYKKTPKQQAQELRFLAAECRLTADEYWKEFNFTGDSLLIELAVASEKLAHEKECQANILDEK